MTADLKPISKRLAQCLRLLASDQPGEVWAAAAAIRRTLAAVKLDVNDFANHVEQAKKFSEEEALELYRRAIEVGRQKAHAELPVSAGFSGVWRCLVQLQSDLRSGDDGRHHGIPRPAPMHGGRHR
jgi:hypothetical protein